MTAFRRLSEASPSTLYHAGTLLAFLLPLLTYWLTVDHSASWWDCPEYILVASQLQVGHAPGNPTWMLFHNIVASAAEALWGSERIALALNLCAGLFSALATALLFQICHFTLGHVFRGRAAARPWPRLAAALCGTLCLGWADSTWFSAVETEVYAMSLFFTALMLRVMLAWARSRDRARARRLLILLAFITGMSIGVHELNLLAIPALALIYVFRRNPRSHCTLRGWLSIAVSAAIIAALLYGMYPGTAMIAGAFEVFAVNTLNLPFSSGIIIYLCLLAVAAVAAPLFCTSSMRSASTLSLTLRTALFFLLILLGGFLLIGSYIVGIVLSIAAATALTFMARQHPMSARTILWMLSFCLLGFSTYLIIPLRSAQMPPVNEAQPSDVFAYISYLKRDQYGKKPLLYGATPYSKPMYRETIGADGLARYDEIARTPLRPAYMKATPGAKVHGRSGLLTAEDSATNHAALADARAGHDRYVLADYRNKVITTPELNMLLPRLTSGKPMDIRNYESWAGMTKENMVETEVSFAFDSLGNAVGKRDNGHRTREKSYRPTYWQNLRELFGYQIAYMYFRYLLWNYAGRQNDYPSAGEIEHGNVLTGITPLDNAIYGDRSAMPPELGSDNKGRNRYFMLPLILGIAGAVAAVGAGRRGKRADAVVLLLFLMTGLAIVLFLNQDPGEARERDYSFLGSFLAFCIWIALGAGWLFNLAGRLSPRLRRARWLPAAAAALLALGIPVEMLAVNWDDHDRSRRSGPDDYARNILGSLDPDAIIFVEGDNYTFPLWYAQEVLGVRRDVTVVNVSYLTTSWYVTQLMQPGRGSKPVRLTAMPQEIAYEAFNTVRFPRTTFSDSTVSVDLRTELRRILDSPGETPRFSANMVRIAVPGGDSIYIDIRKARAGSAAMMLRDVAMLDIVATNALQPRPRPIYWHANVIDRQMTGLAPHTSRTLYARKYTPLKNPTDTAAYLCDEALRSLPTLRYGGADRGIYADPYVGNQISSQRLALLRLADALSARGRHAEALRVARIVYDKFPREVWPYQGLVNRDGDLWQEGLKLAEILTVSGRAAGDSEAVALGEKLRKEETARLRRWHSWFRSLDKWQRESFSRESKFILKAPVN